MWLNTATGRPVPDADVRQISPGVHVEMVRVNKVTLRPVTTRSSEGGETVVAEEDVTVVLEPRGLVIQVPDGTVFDPRVHTAGRVLFEQAIGAQARELHAIFTRGGDQ